MSAVPPELPGIGSTQQKLRPSPGFDPLKAQFAPDEYFLWSRFDGVQTLRDVVLATGLPVERALFIVGKLRSLGAVLLPGETAPPARPAAVPERDPTGPNAKRDPTGPNAKRDPTGPNAKRAAAPERDPTGPTAKRAAAPEPDPTGPVAQADDLAEPTAEELTALAEDNALDAPTRRRILALARRVAARDPWALLGVPNGSTAQQLKRAYFKLSKDIHPDRFFGKQLGSFRDRLPTVFEAVTRAYEKLTSPEPRRSGAFAVATPESPQAPQSPQEYAAELFERAMSLEVGGDALEAMKLFAAAIRLDPQTKYLRRATSCALAAGQPRTALEYAKKAQVQSPSDPSLARLLAIAFKATGALADAEEVLVLAMAMKSENDALGSELRSELAEVRRLRSANER